jgi:hypothetical protein
LVETHVNSSLSVRGEARRSGAARSGKNRIIEVRLLFVVLDEFGGLGEYNHLARVLGIVSGRRLARRLYLRILAGRWETPTVRRDKPAQAQATTA